MSTSVTINDGVVRIKALDVSDDVTVAYIEHLASSDHEAGIINCLQLGARALTFASDKTGAALLADALRSESDKAQLLLAHASKASEQAVTRSTESMEKAIATLLDGLGKDLNKTLDPANTESIIGKLRNSLVNDYQRITTQVRAELDLANPQSPLSALRVELEKNDERRYSALTAQLTQLIEQLAAKAAANTERSKSTRKGTDFEAATLDFLEAESRPRKDLVAYTGREHGLDQNFVGDFVIDVNSTVAHKPRIVMECKNATKNGTTERVRELRKAMSNRGAAFGITVATTSGDFAQAILPFEEDKLIVRVPSLPEGEGWDFTALGIALECARWKALMSRASTGPFDIARISADIERAFAIANNFTESKRKITAGKTLLDGIADYLEDTKRQLLSALENIRDAVNEAEAKSEAA